MEFSIENVEKYWKILNSGNNTEDRKIADEFLIQFKVKLF